MYKYGDAFNQETRNRKETGNKDRMERQNLSVIYRYRFWTSSITWLNKQSSHQVNAPRDRILAFLNEADIRKGPVLRTITDMYRLKAIDWKVAT